jgi:hypothetical protein
MTIEKTYPILPPSASEFILIKELSLHAYHIGECECEHFRACYLKRSDPGSFFVVHQRGAPTFTAILMPNGFLAPTGRQAPLESWFPMLKPHIRDWLALENSGRLLRICSLLVDELEQEVDNGELTEAQARAGRGQINAIRNLVIEGVAGFSEEEVMASFYTWLTGMAKASSKDQREILNIVTKHINKKTKVKVKEVDPELFKEGFRRYLEI